MALQTDIYWATQLNAKYYIYRPVSIGDNPTDYNKWTEMTPEEKADFDNKLSGGPNIIMCYVDKTKVDTSVLVWYKKTGDTYEKYEGNNWQTITDTKETDALKDTNKNLILVVKSDKVAELKSFESKAIKVTYHLIRHGFSCANAKKKITGFALHKLIKDPLLHKIGIAQSMFLGSILQKLNITLDAICSSQLRRSAQTAHCINEGMKATLDAEAKSTQTPKKIFLLPNINELGYGLDNSPIAYTTSVHIDGYKSATVEPIIVDTCNINQKVKDCTKELTIDAESFLLELGKRILPVLKDILSTKPDIKTDITIGIVVHQNLLKKIKDIVFPNSGLPKEFENTSTLVLPTISYIVNQDFTKIGSRLNVHVNTPSTTPTTNWRDLPKSDTIPSKVIIPSNVTYIKPAFPFTQNDYSLNDEELCNEDDEKDDEKEGKLPFEIITTNFSNILASLKQSLTSYPSRSDPDRANDIITINKKENPTEETLQINFTDAFSVAD